MSMTVTQTMVFEKDQEGAFLEISGFDKGSGRITRNQMVDFFRYKADMQDVVDESTWVTIHAGSTDGNVARERANMVLWQLLEPESLAPPERTKVSWAAQGSQGSGEVVMVSFMAQPPSPAPSTSKHISGHRRHHAKGAKRHPKAAITIF